MSMIICSVLFSNHFKYQATINYQKKEGVFMIIAFLDILGFTQLVEHNYQTALDNLNEFNSYIDAAKKDNKLHPVENYSDPDLQKFVEKRYVTSFDNILTMSDSLVITSSDPKKFLEQISSMLCHLFKATNHNFSKQFENIYDVNSSQNIDTYIFEEDGERKVRFEYHKAFPLLFRGGITLEKEHILVDGSQAKGVMFFEQSQFINGENKIGWNVCGQDYVQAVKLESYGKGPRLFCDKSFYEQVEKDRKKYLRKINSDIYEIVWTLECCACGQKDGDSKINVTNGIEDFLKPSINLYKYYLRRQNEDVKDSDSAAELIKHYKQLVILVYRGIYRYAIENNITSDWVKQQLQNELAEIHMSLCL